MFDLGLIERVGVARVEVLFVRVVASKVAWVVGVRVVVGGLACHPAVQVLALHWILPFRRRMAAAQIALAPAVAVAAAATHPILLISTLPVRVASRVLAEGAARVL